MGEDMTPKSTRLPWLRDREGRDRRLQKDDVDLLLNDMAGGDRDQYMFLFGKALKREILLKWGNEKDINKRLVAPRDTLFLRCWDFLTAKSLWKEGLTSNKFAWLAVKNFLEEASNANRTS